MDKKRDKNNQIKKEIVNGKSKIIYCYANNRRIEYVKHNKAFVKLSEYKKQMKTKKSKTNGGADNIIDEFYSKYTNKNMSKEEIINALISLQKNAPSSSSYYDYNYEGFDKEEAENLYKIYRYEFMNKGYVNAN